MQLVVKNKITNRARSQLYIFRGASVVIEGAYNFLLMSGANYYVRFNFHLGGQKYFLGGHCPEMPSRGYGPVTNVTDATVVKNKITNVTDATVVKNKITNVTDATVVENKITNVSDATVVKNKITNVTDATVVKNKITNRARNQLYIFRGASVVIEGAYNFSPNVRCKLLCTFQFSSGGAEIFFGGALP